MPRVFPIFPQDGPQQWTHSGASNSNATSSACHGQVRKNRLSVVSSGGCGGKLYSKGIVSCNRYCWKYRQNCKWSPGGRVWCGRGQAVTQTWRRAESFWGANLPKMEGRDLPRSWPPIIIRIPTHSSVAQSVEQAAVNRWVVGSSPTRGAFRKPCRNLELSYLPTVGSAARKSERSA